LWDQHVGGLGAGAGGAVTIDASDAAVRAMAEARALEPGSAVQFAFDVLAPDEVHSFHQRELAPDLFIVVAVGAFVIKEKRFGLAYYGLEPGRGVAGGLQITSQGLLKNCGVGG